MFKCLPCQTGSSKIENGPETLKNCSLLSENANGNYTEITFHTYQIGKISKA